VKTIVVFFLGSLLSACTLLDRAMLRDELDGCPDVAEQYLAPPDDEAIRAFHTLDLSRQYQVFICASQYVRPPLSEFQVAFASGGDRVAEFLVQQLGSGVDDLTFRDIVYVFSAMQSQGTYDVASETLFLRWLEARAEAMGNPEWREHVTEVVQELRG